MNRQQVKNNLHIMQAFADGKIIQFRSVKQDGPYADWVDAKDHAAFEFGAYEYRVKPEPKRLYVLLRGDGSQVGKPVSDAKTALESLDFYTQHHGTVYGPYTLTEYVEVLKD